MRSIRTLAIRGSCIEDQPFEKVESSCKTSLTSLRGTNYFNQVRKGDFPTYAKSSNDIQKVDNVDPLPRLLNFVQKLT